MTIAQIEQQLLTAAQNNDMTTISMVISSLTATQKAQVHTTVFDTVLQDVAVYSTTHGSANPTLLTFMKDVGAYTDAFAIGGALDTVTGGGNAPNLQGAAYIIDNITATQKGAIGGQALDTALQNIAMLASSNSSVTTQAMTEVQDFMTHLGANTDAFALGGALDTVTGGPSPDLQAAAYIIDNVTATQKPAIGGQALDTALQNIAQLASSGTAISAQAMTEVQDFMTHLGAYTDAFALGGALDMVLGGVAPDLQAAAYIIDNVTATQKGAIGGQALDTALQDFAQLASRGNALSTQAATEIKDFMTHLGANTDAFAIGGALDTVTGGPTPNYAAAAAIVDNVTATQAPAIGGQALDTALQNIAMAASVGVSGAEAEIKDFMTHLGAYTDAFAIGGALDTVTGGPTPNFAAAADIIDNVTATQAPAIGGQALVTALQNLVLPASTIPSSQHAATAEVQDFMTHLGAYTPIAAIDNAVTQLANSPNTAAGLGAVLDNLTTTQWNNLSNLPANLGSGKSLILGTNGNDVIHANANTHGDAIFGGDGSDTLVGGAGSDLLVGGGSGSTTNTLTGGAGADTFLFDRLGSTNVVTDFSKAQGDVLDLTDVLHVANPASVAIGQFVSFTVSGGNTHVEVSANGTGSNWVEATQLTGVTGLTVAGLFTNHEIIV